MAALTQTLQTLNAALVAEMRPLVPKQWKPPTWDGLQSTFCDYDLRIRSSYTTHSALFPSLPDAYYWDLINDTLPLRKRGRMRQFWMEGGPGGKKRPGDFFAEITRTFSDTLETTKALLALISL
jgi:hypothetical protein